MMKKRTKILFLILLAVFLLPAIFGNRSNIQDYKLSATADTNSNYVRLSESSSNYKDDGYTITNYDINVKVNENNVFYITETIECYFNEFSHGIYRYIPIVNEVKREDGSTNKQLAKITNVSINEEYTKSIENNLMIFQIGDPDVRIMGSKVYKISYHYDAGKDGIDEYDEFYFNLFGDKWDTNIEFASFTIEMPKEFDESLIGFSKGYTGAEGYEDVQYGVDGNVIWGYLSKGLPSYFGLTIRLQLPENYFVGEKSHTENYYILSYLIPALILILGVVLYLIHKSKNHYVKTVEFYPPKGLGCLEVALIYKGKVTNQDVSALLVQLASHGYIKIVEKDNKTGKKGTPHKIVILKDEYIGNDQREADLLSVLAGWGKEVTFDQLRSGGFPDRVTNIVHKANRKKLKSKYIKGSFIKIFTMICSIIALITPSFVGVGVFFGMDDAVFSVFLYSIIIAIAMLSKKFKEHIPVLIFLSIFAIILFISQISRVSILGANSVVGLFFGIIVFIILFFASDKSMISRTEKGLELYGAILGFKQFIETAEKSRLEMLCEENPKYFYDILPYAYVLGVSNVWIKKFENITVPPVDWYESSGNVVFVLSDTNRVFTAMNRSARPISTSSSSSSGGGGFSGGGFSGGGIGGGGGGRW